MKALRSLTVVAAVVLMSTGIVSAQVHPDFPGAKQMDEGLAPRPDFPGAKQQDQAIRPDFPGAKQSESTPRSDVPAAKQDSPK
jgi:hypothetical protein